MYTFLLQTNKIKLLLTAHPLARGSGQGHTGLRRHGHPLRGGELVLAGHHLAPVGGRHQVTVPLQKNISDKVFQTNSVTSYLCQHPVVRATTPLLPSC